MRDDRQWLLDILEAIQNIEKYAARGREAFDQEELIQNWVIRHLEIIGEACRAVSSEFQAHHPEVPWKDLVGMRNILVHHYFKIDLGAVWAGVENDLPKLKLQVTALIGQFHINEAQNNEASKNDGDN